MSLATSASSSVHLLLSSLALLCYTSTLLVLVTYNSCKFLLPACSLILDLVWAREVRVVGGYVVSCRVLGEGSSHGQFDGR